MVVLHHYLHLPLDRVADIVGAPIGTVGSRLHYATGKLRSALKADAQPTTREGDLDIIYNGPSVRGLALRFRNAYVGRGNDALVKDFRIVVNYELDFL